MTFKSRGLIIVVPLCALLAWAMGGGIREVAMLVDEGAQERAMIAGAEAAIAMYERGLHTGPNAEYNKGLTADDCFRYFIVERRWPSLWHRIRYGVPSSITNGLSWSYGYDSEITKNVKTAINEFRLLPPRDYPDKYEYVLSGVSASRNEKVVLYIYGPRCHVCGAGGR